MHVTFGCRNMCTREIGGLRGYKRKAAAVACVQFYDCVIKFSRIEELWSCNVGQL